MGLGMDSQSVMAGLLHDVVEDTDCTLEDIQKQFGKEVALLIDGVTKLGKIPYSSREEQQAENLRKMLMAMAEDIRVIIIKFADRMHNLSTLEYMSPKSSGTRPWSAWRSTRPSPTALVSAPSRSTWRTSP